MNASVCRPQLHRSWGGEFLTTRGASDCCAQLQEDLGKRAPGADQARILGARARKVRTGLLRARRLVEYYEDLEDINNHDAMSFINSVYKKVEAAAEDEPTLRQSYAATLSMIEQRGAAISAGIAQSRAAAGGESQPGGEDEP